MQQPGDKNLAHSTPITGTAPNILNSIIDCLNKNKIKFQNLKAIGSDGTVINTGNEGGVIRLFELHLNRPLTWIICLLHLNELPLRHIIYSIDGKSTSPISSGGPIGKAIEKWDNQPVVKFKQIVSEVMVIDKKDLSDDQKYLLEIYNSIVSGKCSAELASRFHGNISHACWLTTANRILRLYISCKKPSANLKIIVTFIVKVYVPCWFDIKKNPFIKDATRHLWLMIKRSRYLLSKLRMIVDDVIQRDAYCAHPEIMLLSMMTDNNLKTRKKLCKLL